MWPSGGLDQPRVRRGVALLRHGEGLRRNVTMLRRREGLRRNIATIHSMEIFVFCFVLLLFRGLVYWTNEDPISV